MNSRTFAKHRCCQKDEVHVGNERKKAGLDVDATGV
jgi:hypothetical protein